MGTMTTSTGEAGPAVLAFIYDRRFTPSPVVLNLRLDHCRAYAAESGLEVAGEWIDVGDDALSDDQRPRFADLVAAMRLASDRGREVVCLVNDWDRISRDGMKSSVLRHMVAGAGGYTATCLGDDDRSHGRVAAR